MSRFVALLSILLLGACSAPPKPAPLSEAPAASNDRVQIPETGQRVEATTLMASAPRSEAAKITPAGGNTVLFSVREADLQDVLTEFERQSVGTTQVVEENQPAQGWTSIR